MLNLIRHLARRTSTGATAASAVLALTLCLSATGCSDSAPEQSVAQNDAAAPSAAPPSAPPANASGGSAGSPMAMPTGPTGGYGAEGSGSQPDGSELTDTAQMEAEYASTDPTALGSDPASAGTETDSTLAGLPEPGSAAYPGSSATPGGPGYSSDPRAGSANAAGSQTFDPAAAYGSGAPGSPGYGNDPRSAGSTAAAGPPLGNPGGPGYAGDPRLAGSTTSAGTPPGEPGGPGYGSDPRNQPGVAGDPAAGIPSSEGYSGTEGGPGGPGAGGGGAAPPADAPEFPAYQLVMGLMKSDLKDMDKYVSKRARGDLQKIGAGKLTDGEKTEYKETFASPQLAAQPRNARGGRQLVLQSGEKMITILVKKEGEEWRVAELSIRDARKK